MVWAILDDYSFTPIELTRETASTVFYKQYNHEGTKWVERQSRSALPWRGGTSEARQVSERLTSAKAEMNQSIARARKSYRKTVEKLTRKSDESPEGEDT